MKIVKLNESDFESINRYLSVMSTDDYRNLCMVDFDDKRYVIASDDNVIYIVENDNGELNPMEINLDEKGDFISYTTEAFSYVFDNKPDSVFIQKTDRLLMDVRHLHFVKNENCSSVLEYRQFIADNFGILNAKYELNNHGSNESSAIAYTNYHLPTQLEVHESKESRLGFKEKIYFYKLMDESNYKRAYIVRDNKYYLMSFLSYPGSKLIKVFCDSFGFMDTIDDDLRNYMLGTNIEINNRKQLVLGYQDFKKGQM